MKIVRRFDADDIPVALVLRWDAESELPAFLTEALSGGCGAWIGNFRSCAKPASHILVGFSAVRSLGRSYCHPARSVWHLLACDAHAEDPLCTAGRAPRRRTLMISAAEDKSKFRELGL